MILVTAGDFIGLIDRTGPPTDYIDVYFSHFPDEKTQVSETLAAYEKLIKQGKVRAIGASNHSVEQLQTASGEASKKGVHDYSVIQPEYNLYDRDYERELRGYAIANDIGVVSYFGLASGFLTGKYKKGDPETGSRAGLVKKYFNEKGWRILDALAVVSARHGCQPAEVALAWLIGSKGVTAPIASATNLDQLESMLNAARLSLTEEDRKLLDVSV